MNDYFHFKKFSVSHRRSSMKVGTDGVLLGAWASVEDVNTILDIGTGTGVIALMMAQRTLPEVHIDAVERNAEACEDAKENFRSSPWNERINLHHSDIQSFYPEKKYDCIISNPPYFINSYKPPDKNRHHARHADTLSFDDLLKTSIRLLSPKGRLAVILPVAESMTFMNLAQTYSFHCTRKWAFRTRSHKPIERWLLEFSVVPLEFTEGEIFLYAKGEQWSDEYRLLTKEFYLKS